MIKVIQVKAVVQSNTIDINETLKIVNGVVIIKMDGYACMVHKCVSK